jgi:putative oligomerization/nucleic acid binding protein
MLFLYRPRQTWLPYRLPRNLTVQQQRAYNLQMQDRFDATRRVPPAPPAAAERDPLDALQRLGEMHASGTLTDEEFATAKAKVLGTAPDAT